MKLHIEFCKQYGLGPEDIQNQEEDQGRRTPTFLPMQLTVQ